MTDLHDPDILVLTETWLKGDEDAFLLHQICNQTESKIFNFRYFNRNYAIGGGVAILYKNFFSTELLYSNVTTDFELHLLRLRYFKITFFIAAVYRPPNGNLKSFLEVFIDTVLYDCLEEPIVILGDFNVHVNDDSATSTKLLKDTLFEFDLIQNVKQSTHNKGNILDLLISNSSALLKDVDIDETTPSDHYFITCVLESFVISKKKKLKMFRPYAKVSWDRLAYDLNLTLSLNDHITDLDFKSQFLIELMGHLIEEHAPTDTKYFNDCRFYDSYLRELKRVKRKAERAYRKHPNLTNRLLYREKLADSKLAFASKKAEYFGSLLQQNDRSSLKHSALKDLLGKSNIETLPQTTKTDNELAEDFNTFFLEKVDKLTKDRVGAELKN